MFFCCHQQHDGNYHHHYEPVEVVCLHVPLVMPSSRASRLSSCNTAPSGDLSLFIIVSFLVWWAITMMIIIIARMTNHHWWLRWVHAVWSSALNKGSLWMVEQKVWSRCVHFCDNMFWQKSQDKIMTHLFHLYGGKLSPVGKLRI